jgi:hypothetical protein
MAGNDVCLSTSNPNTLDTLPLIPFPGHQHDEFSIQDECHHPRRVCDHGKGRPAHYHRAARRSIYAWGYGALHQAKVDSVGTQGQRFRALRRSRRLWREPCSDLLVPLHIPLRFGCPLFSTRNHG